MFDIGARLIAIGVLLFFSGATGWVPFPEAVCACVAEAIVAGIAYRATYRRSMTPGVAGLIAIFESAIVAYVVARTGTLPMLGILALAPCMLAAAEYGTRSIFMAPVVAANILGAACLVDRQVPSNSIFMHAGCVLALGLLLDRLAPSNKDAGEIDTPSMATESVADLELRETFRKLRDAYRALETASRRDRTSVELAETRIGAPNEVARRLASRLSTLTGARSVVIYSVASFGGSLVVKGTHGDVPEALQEAAIDVDLRLPLINLIDRSTLATRALREDTAPIASIPLLHQGKVIGLISVSHPNHARLEEARMVIEDALDDICEILSDARQREDTDRRLREAELLYDLRGLVEGVESPHVAAERFASELRQILHADHVGVFLLEGDQPQTLAEIGHRVDLLEHMSFANGPGIAGWLAIDAPELLMHEVRKDARCSAQVAVKARIGSYLVVPLEGEGGVRGYVTAASAISGSLGREAAETMRVASLELARALFPGSIAGIMLPSEFQQHIQRHSGHVIWLQPMGKQDLETRFGKPAMVHVLRRLTGRIRLRLPLGGALCRRSEGDFVTFLPGADEAVARRWANETVAYASMLGFKTPDGSQSVPLALRAKVAPINNEIHEFLEELSA